MKHLFFLLLLFGLTDCAGLRSAHRAKKIARAQAVLREYGAATPPEQQLSDLLKANPKLEGKKLRIVRERDTIRIPGATVTVTVPAESTPVTDKALIDSLFESASTRLDTKDSLAFKAQLRAILAARPKLGKDTVRQRLGPLTVESWVDRHGVPHTTVTSAPQQFGYEKAVTITGPVVVKREMTAWEQVTLFLKNAAGIIIGVLVVVGGVWAFYFIQRQRNKPPTS